MAKVEETDIFILKPSSDIVYSEIILIMAKPFSLDFYVP